MYNLNPTPSERDGGGGGTGNWKTSPPVRKWNMNFPKGGSRDSSYSARMNVPYEERDRNDWSFRRDERDRYPPRGKREWEGRDVYSRSEYRGSLDAPRSPKKRKFEMERESPIYHPKKDFKRDYYTNGNRSPSPPNDKDRYREFYEPSRHYSREEFSRGSFYPHYTPGKGGSGERWERYMPRSHYDHPSHYNRLRDLDREYRYSRGSRYDDWEREKRVDPYFPRDPRESLEPRDYHMGHSRFREHEGREFYPPRDREFEGRDPRDPREFEDPREFIGEGRDPREFAEPRDPREFIGEGRDPREFIEGRDPREFAEPRGRDPREFGSSNEAIRESREFSDYPREFYGDPRESMEHESMYQESGVREPFYFRSNTDRMKEEEDSKSREDYRREELPSSLRATSPEESMKYSDSQKQGSSSPHSSTSAQRAPRLGFGQGLVEFESAQPKEDSPEPTKRSVSPPASEKNPETTSLLNPPSSENLSFSVTPPQPQVLSQPVNLVPGSVFSPSPSSIPTPTPFQSNFPLSTTSPTPIAAPSPAILSPQPTLLQRIPSEDTLPRDPRLRFPSSSSPSIDAIKSSSASNANIGKSDNEVGSSERMNISSPSPPPTPKQPLPSKEEVLHAIEKLDSELSKIDTQIANLKRPKKPEQKHGKHVPLEEIIKEENYETIKSQKEIWAFLIPENLTNTLDPLYKEPSDLPVYHENINLHEKNKNFIARVVSDRNKQVKDLTKSLVETFTRYQEAWKKKLVKFEQKRARKDKKQKKGQSSSSSGNSKEDNFYGPSHRRPLINARNRVTRSQGDLFVRTEEELEQVVDNLRKEEDPDSLSGGKYVHTLVKIPDMILDSHTPRYVDDNGLVVDPMAVERERKLVNLWSDEEKEIFLEKFLTHHKNFAKIADFLKNKTTENVIWYYYANKRTLDLKKLKEQQPKRRVYRKSSAASITPQPSQQTIPSNIPAFIPRELANLGITSLEKVGSPPARRLDDKTRRSGRPSLLSGNPSNTTSISPALGPVNPMSPLTPLAPSSTSSSNINSVPANSSSPSIDGWNDTERELFKEGLEKYGEDFKSISQLLGTKNPLQCKNYYHNLKKKKNLQETSDQTPKSKSPSIVKPEGAEKSEDGGRLEANEDSNSTTSTAEFQEQEVADVVKYFEAYGKSWRKIANLIPSKTATQLRAFFKSNKNLFGSKLPPATTTSVGVAPTAPAISSPPSVPPSLPVPSLVIDLSSRTTKKEENSKKRPRKVANEKNPLLSEKVDKRKKKQQKVATIKPGRPEESPTIIISTLASSTKVVPSPPAPSQTQPPTPTSPTPSQSLPSQGINRSNFTVPIAPVTTSAPPPSSSSSSSLDSLFLLASVSEQRIHQNTPNIQTKSEDQQTQQVEQEIQPQQPLSPSQNQLPVQEQPLPSPSQELQIQSTLNQEQTQQVEQHPPLPLPNQPTQQEVQPQLPPDQPQEEIQRTSLPEQGSQVLLSSPQPAQPESEMVIQETSQAMETTSIESQPKSFEDVPIPIETIQHFDPIPVGSVFPTTVAPLIELKVNSPQQDDMEIDEEVQSGVVISNDEQQQIQQQIQLHHIQQLQQLQQKYSAQNVPLESNSTVQTNGTQEPEEQVHHSLHTQEVLQIPEIQEEQKVVQEESQQPSEPMESNLPGQISEPMDTCTTTPLPSTTDLLVSSTLEIKETSSNELSTSEPTSSGSLLSVPLKASWSEEPKQTRELIQPQQVEESRFPVEATSNQSQPENSYQERTSFQESLQTQPPLRPTGSVYVSTFSSSTYSSGESYDPEQPTDLEEIGTLPFTHQPIYPQQIPNPLSLQMKMPQIIQTGYSLDDHTRGGEERKFSTTTTIRQQQQLPHQHQQQHQGQGVGVGVVVGQQQQHQQHQQQQPQQPQHQQQQQQQPTTDASSSTPVDCKY